MQIDLLNKFISTYCQGKTAGRGGDGSVEFFMSPVLFVIFYSPCLKKNNILFLFCIRRQDKTSCLSQDINEHFLSEIFFSCVVCFFSALFFCVFLSFLCVFMLEALLGRLKIFLSSALDYKHWVVLLTGPLRMMTWLDSLRGAPGLVSLYLSCLTRVLGKDTPVFW